jgi:transcriptional regulator with XRE-family HTH domain
MNSRALGSVAILRRANRDGNGRRLREEMRISLREAATALGVSSGSLSKWERNLEQPKGDRAIAYAQLLATWLEIAG